MRLDIKTSARVELVDITWQVAQAVSAFAEKNGAVLVFCPHTTAAVTINENADPDVVLDLIKGLASIAPLDGGWRHAEGNSDGHLKTSLVGPSVLVPLSDGRLSLGTWQGIYLCEFDGPRSRRIDVTVLSGLR